MMSSLVFLNPWFLAGAAAAAVPSIIHLIQRRRIQQVVFGSVRFLRTMSQRVVRRRRLTELLLILLRTAALVLLAVAFARPFLWQSRGQVGSESLLGQEATVLLLDQSYLMRAPGRMDRARAEAIKVLDSLPPGSPVAVAAFDERLRTLCPFDGTAAQAHEAIRDLQPGWGAADVETALEQVQQTLLGPRKEQRRKIHLISGFPQSSCKNDSNFHLPAGTMLDPIDVAGPAVSNLAITRVEVPRMVVASAAGKDPTQKDMAAKDLIGVQVLNASDQEVRDAEVALSVGGKPVEKRSLTIKPRLASVNFSYAFGAAGDTVGQISVSGTDALPADNQAYFCVSVAPRLRVLLLDGDSRTRLVRNGAFFLETALAPDAASSFEVRRITPASLTAGDLKDADAVLLSNVAELSAEQVKALQAFLASGRGVAFFCGEGLDADKFNASLGVIAPCKLWKPALAAEDEAMSLTWVDYTHEIFKPFAGPRSGDFALARYQQYWLVKDSQQAKALARFSNRNPALLEDGGAADAGKPSGTARGRVLLFTSSADLGWNDLPVKAVFPPLIHQVVKRLCTEQAVGTRTMLVGQPAAVRLPGAAAKAELLSPADAKSPLELHADAGEQVGSFTPDQPGVYQVQSAAGRSTYAVNLDARAVDPAHLDMPLWLARIRPLNETGTPELAGVSEIVSGALIRERIEQQQMLWIYLIGLVVLVLAAEMALAAWAGKAG